MQVGALKLPPTELITNNFDNLSVIDDWIDLDETYNRLRDLLYIQ